MRFETSDVLLPSGLAVRFLHHGVRSEALVGGFQGFDAAGYRLRLQSWDDNRTPRAQIEKNLLARINQCYDQNRPIGN